MTTSTDGRPATKIRESTGGAYERRGKFFLRIT